jgi:DNA-cytosine methyltransferase
MNVLSVFDGMSCGQIALNELGFKIDKYYAAEIDKHAITQTQHNFPNTVQLGSVTDVRAKDLEKIDLFIGGSPCQGFSFAGKQLNFDDPRSALFFEYVRLWKEIKAINPDAKFLLENVNMKKEYLRVISEYLGVFPVRINSNLVSAQNRDRWYWTNIKTKETGLFSELWSDIPQPEDKGILLKDILQDESEVNDKYYLKDISKYDLSIARPSGIVSDHKLIKNKEKAACLDANYFKGIANHQERTGVCVAMRGRNPENPSDRKTGSPTEQRLEPKTDGKTNCLTSVAKDNLIMQVNPSKESGGKQPYQQNRCYHIEGQMPALMTEYRGNITDGYKLRRLTPIECSRLQTIPEWYEWIVSDTQIYRMLGNGWTVEVIKHIFSFLNGFEKTNVRGQKIIYGQISTNVDSKNECSTCG